jgi:hypothetical protein
LQIFFCNTSSTVFTFKGVVDDDSDISDDLRLAGYIRNEYFSQELLLELQGLQAFLNQKLVSMEAEEEVHLYVCILNLYIYCDLFMNIHICIEKKFIKWKKLIHMKY